MTGSTTAISSIFASLAVDSTVMQDFHHQASSASVRATLMLALLINFAAVALFGLGRHSYAFSLRQGC